jgi:hypothetical protein
MPINNTKETKRSVLYEGVFHSTGIISSMRMVRVKL